MKKKPTDFVTYADLNKVITQVAALCDSTKRLERAFEYAKVNDSDEVKYLLNDASNRRRKVEKSLLDLIVPVDSSIFDTPETAPDASAGADGWVEKSPMQDGSGTYRVNNVVYTLSTDLMDSRRYWYAYLNGQQVVKGSRNFSTVLKRLRAIDTTAYTPSLR